MAMDAMAMLFGGMSESVTTMVDVGESRRTPIELRDISHASFWTDDPYRRDCRAERQRKFK
jgi:hypothetical protein